MAYRQSGLSIDVQRKMWRESAAQDRIKHPVTYLLSGARKRARLKGLPCNLEQSDITIPKFCPVLDIPLYIKTGSPGAGSNSPSLDRIRPELGYIKGNTIVVSYRANTIRNNATVEELEKILEFYKNKCRQN